jgi:ubiquinol-cytochrome c reductase cytochrome b subunit
MKLSTVFPTRWSLVFGVAAATSLGVLVLSGVYLALFFDPSMAPVTYVGPVRELHGVPMSRAYASALEISFEVRGGLFVRQLHNWAASLFLASLLAGLLARFFTGTFRRPRRVVWLGGVLLLVVGMVVAFTGVLVLDDLLSGTSLRVISGYTLGIPVIGTWVHGVVFGGEFPGREVIPRLYLVHLAVAVILVGSVVSWAVLARRRGRSRSATRRRTGRSSIGVPASNAGATRVIAFAAVTVGVLGLMACAFQVNPIWKYGPADPAHVSSWSTPPWYFGWVDGAVRLWPPWEVHVGEHAIAPWFWPSVVFLSLSFAALALYPWVERRVTRDPAPHARPQRAREAPVRTALGAAVLVLYGSLQVAAAIDVFAFGFHLSADGLFWAARVAVLVLPALAYTVTHRICVGLQRSDRAVLEHGVDTGVLRRLPHGGFIAVHRPPEALDERPPAVGASPR